MLGVTFKPGTDDLREAPSLANIPLLLEQGACIYAYDPVGLDNLKRFYPEGSHKKGSITYANTIEDALKDANVCFIFTEWKQIKDIKPETYKKLMRTPLVYDGSNIYPVDAMKDFEV